ncbi:MAG: hypothetical protein ACJ0G7_09585 [Parasynechococcus sp.]
MLLDPRWIPLNVGVLTKKSFWICSLDWTAAARSRAGPAFL